MRCAYKCMCMSVRNALLLVTALCLLPPLEQKLCEKVLRFVDHMAKKLRNSGYYLEEREKEDVILQFVSEKVRHGLYYWWLYYISYFLHCLFTSDTVLTNA